MEVRMLGGRPWGFSLVGGTDFRSPLRVGKVSANGKAEQAGLLAGQYLVKINGVECGNLRHMEAQGLVRAATDTLVLHLAVVEMRRKTSQPKLVDSRRLSTSSLPRGMTSISSLWPHRTSYHDDQSVFVRSPRSSTSSIGGSESSAIPVKPAPPPGSKPIPLLTPKSPPSIITSDATDVGSPSISVAVKEPSPSSVAPDNVFKSLTEESGKSLDTKEDTLPLVTATTSMPTASTALTFNKPPPPAVTKKPAKPISKQEVTQPVTQPVTHDQPKSVAEEETSHVHVATEDEAQSNRWLASRRKSSKDTSSTTTHIPSAPKYEGGSSWYKSLFRSMLANEDEVTIPSKSASPPTQRKPQSATAAFTAAANETASTRLASNTKSHDPVDTTSYSSASYSTTSSYKPPPSDDVSSDDISYKSSLSSTNTKTSSYKPPPSDDVSSEDISYKSSISSTNTKTTEDSVVDEPVNADTMEFMTSEQVRMAIRQTLTGTSSNRGYRNATSTTSQETPAPKKNIQDEEELKEAYRATLEDIPLDKMHPIISDTVMSDSVITPVVNIISPSEDEPAVIATTTTAIESTQTTSTVFSQSDFPEVKLNKMHPIISDAVNTDDVGVTKTTTEDTSVSDIMTVLEELNDVIASTGVSNTSSVGVADVPASSSVNVVGDSSRSSSRHSNISDTNQQIKNSIDHLDNKGSRSSSRQSNHENRDSRSSSRQSNTGSHDNRGSRGGSVSSEGKRKRKSPPAESARALYSFSAQSIKEVSFRKGAIIKLTGTIDNNWLEGEVDGVKGIFPTSYVELITAGPASATPEPRKSPTPLPISADQPHALAKYKFDAVSAKELGFQKGDTLYLTKRVDDNWYKGYNAAGEVGIFPCSYVQIVVDLSEKVEYVKSATPPIEAEIYPKDVEQKPKKKTPPSRPSQPPLLAKENKVEDSAEPVASGNHTSETTSAAASFDIAGGRYESLFSYEPCNSDELALEVGDTVIVLERCDDGWFMGTCERTGEFGAFPGNFVKQLD